MFRMNRCYEKPMNYSQEATYKYSNSNMKQNEYPQAMPAGMPDMSGMNMMG